MNQSIIYMFISFLGALTSFILSENIWARYISACIASYGFFTIIVWLVTKLDKNTYTRHFEHVVVNGSHYILDENRRGHIVRILSPQTGTAIYDANALYAPTLDSFVMLLMSKPFRHNDFVHNIPDDVSLVQCDMVLFGDFNKYKQTECITCYDKLIKNICMLPCAHACCRNCFNEMYIIRDNALACFLCKQTFIFSHCKEFC